MIVSNEEGAANENVRWTTEKHPFLTASFTQPANSQFMQDLLADFRLG